MKLCTALVYTLSLCMKEDYLGYLCDFTHSSSFMLTSEQQIGDNLYFHSIHLKTTLFTKVMG